jgi:hypothetical protein
MERHFSKKDVLKSSAGTKENRVADLGLINPTDEFHHDNRVIGMMLKEHIYKWVHANHLVIRFHKVKVK